MLQLLNPIWMFGIAGTLVPLIIHLWNLKPGKTLKIGSITLMGESSRQNSRSLKLNELLLLLIRCLLIILISLILAEPVWLSKPVHMKPKTWVLVERGDFVEARSHFRPAFDSLFASLSELHYLEPGFPKVDLAEAVDDTIRIDAGERLPYFSLLRLLQEKVPHGTRIYVFTGGELNRFKGSLPDLPLSWRTYTPSDSNSRWIEHAYLTSAGQIRVTLSESGPRMLKRTLLNIDPGSPQSGIEAGIISGKPVVSLGKQRLIADTSSIKISVYSENTASGEDYLNAALYAIQKYTMRKITVSRYTPAARPDVLFWLSPKELPAAAAKSLKPGDRIFKYADTKVLKINSWVSSTDDGRSIQNDHVSLQKRNTYPDKSAALALWEDGFGTPLLDVQKVNEASIFTLYTRLDPEWTGLVWSPGFVDLLMPFIIPEHPSIQQEALDKRNIRLQTSLLRLPTSDLRPQTSDLRPQTSDLRPPTSDLRPQTSDPRPQTSGLTSYFWILLIVLYFIERYLTFRKSAII